MSCSDVRQQMVVNCWVDAKKTKTFFLVFFPDESSFNPREAKDETDFARVVMQETMRCTA